MIWEVVILSLLLILNPVWDWWLIEVKNIGIKHRLQGFVVAGIVLSTSILTYLHTHNLWALWVALLYPSVRWFVHDLLLNIFRGKPLNYLGELQDGFEDSWTDTFLQRGYQYLFKSIFLIISIVVVLLLNYFLN